MRTTKTKNKTKRLILLLALLFIAAGNIIHGQTVKKTAAPNSSGQKLASIPKLTAAQYKPFVQSIEKKYLAQEYPDAQKTINDAWKQAQVEKDSVSFASFTTVALVMTNRINAAVVLAARDLIADTSNVLAANNLGAALHSLDAYKEAVQVFQFARKQQPQNAMLLTNLATTVLDMGDIAAAKELLQEAVRFDPEYCTAWRVLGDIYISEFKINEAINAYLKTAPCGFSAIVKNKLDENSDRDNPPKPPGIPNEVSGAESARAEQQPMQEGTR